jgi:hypothetical protein
MPIFVILMIAFGMVILALCIFAAIRSKRHPGSIVAKFGNTKGYGTFVDEEQEISKETE